MNRLLLSVLAIAAIALGVNQASAGSKYQIRQYAENNTDNGAVVIEETTVSAYANVPNGAYNTNMNAMQSLPGDNGVEVAPLDNPENTQPVIVEEDMLIQQTEAGE